MRNLKLLREPRSQTTRNLAHSTQPWDVSGERPTALTNLYTLYGPKTLMQLLDSVADAPYRLFQDKESPKEVTGTNDEQ